MLSKKILTGLIALSLTACGTLSASRPAVPRAWTEEVAEPVPQGRLTGHLVLWAEDLRTALRVANGRLKTIREWSDAELD